MESNNGEDYTQNLLLAQTHVWNQIFSFMNSMSLKCAIELNIIDVVHNYGQPMPLSELVASLPIHPSKSAFVHRLMRILTLSSVFSQQNDDDELQEERYVLTNASRILLKDHPFCMTPFLDVILDPNLVKPWYQLSNWFKKCDNNNSPFESEYGMPFWEFASHEKKLGSSFHDAMTSDSRLVSSVLIDKFKGVFEGVESLVDVGGGNGTMAKAIAKSFPHVECIVFDLPHVVSGLEGSSENMKYVGGNMFEAIPSSDAVLLKCILHNWNDEECVKLLKKCKEAIITKKGKKGKLIIIDMVVGNHNGDKGSLETQIFYDMAMMIFVNGKERNEKEWAKLFLSSGFNNYKIIPIMMSSRSLIEVYP